MSFHLLQLGVWRLTKGVEAAAKDATMVYGKYIYS